MNKMTTLVQHEDPVHRSGTPPKSLVRDFLVKVILVMPVDARYILVVIKGQYWMCYEHHLF